MKKYITLIEVILFSFLFFNCNNRYKRDLKETQEKLEVCQDNKSNQVKFLNLLEKANMPKRFNTNFTDTIHFNLNLKSNKPQVIHLSSDDTSIPFMVLCKVNGIQNGNKFTFDYLELAIRSIGKNPASFFKIKGVPTLEQYKVGKYKYRLKADIDLNLPSRGSTSGRVRINSNCQTVDAGEFVDVKINPESLIKSLDSLETVLKDNQISYDSELIQELEKFCCAGVICSLNLMM